MFTPRDPDRPAAIAFMLLATLFIAGTTLLAKAIGTGALGPALHPLQISHGRFAFALVAIGTATLILRPELSRPNLRLHIARTSFGWAGVSLMFASVAYIPLSDATAISFLNPIFGMLLAIPILGERVGPWKWAAAAIALSGAAILLRPGPDSFQAAALLALAAALMIGFEVVFIKMLSGREPAIQILLVNNILGLCIASVAVLWVWAAPTPAQWAALVGIGFLMAAAQASFVNAVARAEASFILPFSYVTLVVAAIYDALVFRVIPDWVSVLGAAVIVAGAVILAWREGRTQGLSR